MSTLEGARLFEDRRPSEEEEQPEKKRPGKEPLYEEEMKRQKVKDEYVDHDFDEGDTDEDEEDDFTTRCELVENLEYNPRYDPDGEEKRRCLDEPRCLKHQHAEAFEGLPIFELFKVKVRFNDQFSSDPMDGRFYGAIVTFPTEDNPDPIYYYWVSKQKPDSIALDSVNKTILLPLSNPRPRPPIDDNNGILLRFAFKVDGEDIFKCGCPYENPELFDYGCGNSTANYEGMYLIPGSDRCTRKYGAFIARRVIGEPLFDPILMGAYYSVYYGAWATVDVQFLEKGVSTFYGSIFARPCIFFRRIRLLSIQPNDQKGEFIQKSGSVNLTRSVVAVPSYASLIIAAVLYDHVGKPIVRGKTFFPAQEKGGASDMISHEGIGILKVTVKWECHP